MDNLTHTLTGLALARAGLGQLGPGTTLALALSCNVPDLDVVYAWQSTIAYLEHHRGFSHSVYGAPLLALALALVLRLVVRGGKLLPLAGCSLLGVAVHVFMDLWTSYGTRVLAPVNGTWYTWDLVFIVDPLILVLLLAGVGLPRYLANGRRIAALALGLVLAYVGARGVLHARALDQARALVPSGSVRQAAVLPHPIDPFRWRALVDTGDAYWIGPIHLGGSTARLERRPKAAETAVVSQARALSAVASVFLDFSRFPWLELRAAESGTTVVWRDLRFERPGRESFVTRVTVSPEGRVAAEDFSF